DPLEILFVREVMRRNVVALPVQATHDAVHGAIRGHSGRGGQRLYPVIDDRKAVVERRDGRLVGMIALTDLLKARALNLAAGRRRETVRGGRLALRLGSSGARRPEERI